MASKSTAIPRPRGRPKGTGTKGTITKGASAKGASAKRGAQRAPRKQVSRQGPVIPRDGLAREVQRLIHAKELSQTAAAAVVQDAPSQISLLMGGHLEVFSAERLIRMLLRLNRDVEIVVRRAARSTHPGRVIVRVEKDGARGEK